MTEETKHKEQEQDGTLEERREIAIDRRKSVVDRRSSFDRRRGPGHRGRSLTCLNSWAMDSGCKRGT